LERMVTGARERVEKLEKRMSRKLGNEAAKEKYSRFTGAWEYEIPGHGKLIINVFVHDGLLWGSAEGGVLGERAEFIPVEGRALEFKLDSSEQGLIDVEFVEDEKGAVDKSQFHVPSANLKGTGFKKRP
jgi:hypothetical protein